MCACRKTGWLPYLRSTYTLRDKKFLRFAYHCRKRWLIDNNNYLTYLLHSHSYLEGIKRNKKLHLHTAYEKLTETLIYLASHLFEHLDNDSEYFQRLERMIVVLYDRVSSLSSVNDAREELFCRCSRAMDRIPPTQNALFQHSKCAVYQAEFGPQEQAHNKNFLLLKDCLGT